MKKAARSLSVVVLAIAAVAAVVATGWFVHAQDPPPPPGGDAVTIEEKEAQAASLAAEGQHAAAAALYEEIALLSGDTLDGQRRAVEAGRQYGLAEQPTKAIEMYNRAIEVGNRYTDVDYGIVTQHGWRLKALTQEIKKAQPLLYDAMCEKAQVCYQVGDPAEASRVLAGIRATFSDCDHNHRDRLYPLEALLTGEDAEAIAVREKAACGLFDQANAAFRNRDHDTANALIASILGDYPQTSAVLRAMDLKARILWKQVHRDDAVAIYSQVLDRTKDVAPECEFARMARSRIAYLNSRRLYHELRTRQTRGEAVASEDWQRMRDLCRESDRRNRELAEVIQSDVLIANSLIWEGRYEEAVQVVDQGFRDHYIDQCRRLQVLKACFASLQDAAARALAKMGRCQEALDRFNWIIQSANGTSGASEEYLIAPAHFGIRVHLYDCEGFRGVAEKAAEDLFRRFPHSKAAEMLRRHID